MKLDEIKISRAIIENYHKKLMDCLNVDVAIAGAGPAGMCCAYYLAKKTRRLLFSKEDYPWAEVAEETTVENSKEVCHGLYVCGMSANAVFGGPRTGHIFGGMLLSGKK